MNYIRQNYPKAYDYIQWGEKQGYQKRPTCKSRTFWWDVRIQGKQDIIVLRFRDQRNWTPIVTTDVSIGDVVFVGKYLNCDHSNDLNALLNSTLHILSTEVLGRINLGEGLLTTYGPEIINFLSLNPFTLTPSQHQRLLSTFKQMASREVRSIFEELGFSLCGQWNCSHPEHPYEFVRPEVLTLEQVQRASPDRFELDSVVFDVLGLTEKERLEVYKAVVELVKTRLVKAKSVQKEGRRE